MSLGQYKTDTANRAIGAGAQVRRVQSKQSAAHGGPTDVSGLARRCCSPELTASRGGALPRMLMCETEVAATALRKQGVRWLNLTFRTSRQRYLADYGVCELA